MCKVALNVMQSSGPGLQMQQCKYKQEHWSDKMAELSDPTLTCLNLTLKLNRVKAVTTQNVKPRQSLTGRGHLQELRLYWAKILSHKHKITAETYPMLYLFNSSEKTILRKNTVLHMGKCLSLVLNPRMR